jgi:hypothetical protein
VILCALFYDVRGLSIAGISTDYMLCFYDMTNRKIMLTPLRIIKIDTSGGDGGEGGNGGKGGKGAEGSPDGQDGNGGDGGRGGDGGTIKLFYSDPAVLEYIKMVGHGGKGGSYGLGSISGNRGRNGKSGEVIKQKVDSNTMKDILSGIKESGMDSRQFIYQLP